MRIDVWVRTIIMCGVFAVSLAAQATGGAPQAAQPPRVAMTLTITAWPDGGQIPVKYTQAGEQVSPALAWGNVPANTASFVLHMRDPDVARNKTTEDQVHGRCSASVVPAGAVSAAWSASVAPSVANSIHPGDSNFKGSPSTSR